MKKGGRFLQLFLMSICHSAAVDGSDDNKLFCFSDNIRGIELLRSQHPHPAALDGGIVDEVETGL